MKVIDKKDTGYYIALGSFDGLHKGHLSLIEKCIELSKINNCNSMVFSFSNHPRTVINPDKKIEYLMNNNEKINILKNEGIDKVVLREFNKEFMELSAEGFIEKLCNEYNVKGIVVGFNYKFGHKNLGDTKLLEKLSKIYNYDLKIMEPLLFDGYPISSTRIRKAIRDGEIECANKMLTRPYNITGKIIHGRQLGRTIGFPTANLKMNFNKIIPCIGVYYSNVKWNNKIYKGITSVGKNPTVEGKSLTIETYILDFDKEIYGDEITLYFLERIRGEIKFNSIYELKNQLKDDEKFAQLRRINHII